MTRAEAYAAAFAEGCRWAEYDLRAQDGRERDQEAEIREDVRYALSDEYRAWCLGRARGYRDTLARYDAGTLTREMFELAPRAPR